MKYDRQYNCTKRTCSTHIDSRVGWDKGRAHRICTSFVSCNNDEKVSSASGWELFTRASRTGHPHPSSVVLRCFNTDEAMRAEVDDVAAGLCNQKTTTDDGSGQVCSLRKACIIRNLGAA